MSEAPRAAQYILQHARARWPHSWRQGVRKAAPPTATNDASVREVCEQRVRCMSELALEGLLLMDRGFRVTVSSQPFAAHEVLRLQAQAARCVSLLPEGAVVPPPHEDALDFVLHDLCHLAKFAEPAHHHEQVGFFAALERAFAHPVWCEVERGLDEHWQRDRAQVSADMNGACIYLFAVLKMKLKMAARRRLWRESGQAAPVGGKLSSAEQAAFEGLFAALLAAFELPAPLRHAAELTNARRDSPEAAALLANHFGAIGREVCFTQG